jgi:hypothetical protein
VGWLWSYFLRICVCPGMVDLCYLVVVFIRLQALCLVRAAVIRFRFLCCISVVVMRLWDLTFVWAVGKGQRSVLSIGSGHKV